jgi:hypothetical protein
MNRDILQKLVEQAKNDPKFLHTLVFDPESALQQVDYLDRKTKAALVGTSPEEIIGTIIGVRPSVESPQDYAP